jgi:hypothetical protein
VYIEKVLPQITGAIEEVESMLEQTMPDPLRAGLEGEHRRLAAAHEALTGEGKSHLHELRAKMRWAGVRSRSKDIDPAKKKVLEKEISNLKNQIERETKLRSNK